MKIHLAGPLLLLAGQLCAAPFVTETVSMAEPRSLDLELRPSYRTDDFKDQAGRSYTATLTRLDAAARWVPAARWEMYFALPYVKSELDGPGGDDEAGLGQVILGGKRAFRGDLGAALRLELPTGDQDDLLGEGTNVAAHFLWEKSARGGVLAANAGYVFKGEFTSNNSKVDPGDVLQLSGAYSKARNNVDWTGELIVYLVGDADVAGASVADSGGTALELLLGAGKPVNDWYLKGALALGLGDEEVSSLDLNRGAGDYRLIFSASRRLGGKKK